MSEKTTPRVGQYVEWSWGQGTARGKIDERFEAEVSRTIDGNEVTRRATPDEPAFLIVQEDGQRVLKSVTEVEPAS